MEEMFDEYGISKEFEIVKESERWALYDIHQGQVPDGITQAKTIAAENGHNIFSSFLQKGDTFKVRGAWAFLLYFKG